MIEDNVAPVAVCQDITVQLDPSGNATIIASQIDNGSNDACGIQSLALNITTFNCANVNGNTVILTVTDVNGNISTCSATVTIEDNVAPIALCQNVTVQLDNTGNGSTTAATVNNGSSDNCAIASLAMSQTAFVCSEVGANTEILTVTDVNGNSTTCTTTITVEDNVAPVAVCQSITVQLDNTGNATITASQIDNGSNDACGIQSLALNITTFNCANVNGNTVILTVTDVNSNTSICSANNYDRRQCRADRALPERDGAARQYWQRINNHRFAAVNNGSLRCLCNSIPGLEPSPHSSVQNVGGNTEDSHRDRCQWQHQQLCTMSPLL
jgi:hypothetical protein